MLLVRQIAIALMLLVSCVCSTTLASDALENDFRLDKKITLQLGLVTLEKLVDEISKQTEVKIEVGKGKYDWQVRERKTIVFANDIPAKKILKLVADLHHYRLSSYGDETNRYYRIWQDLKARNEEEGLRNNALLEPLKGSWEAMDEMASLKDAAKNMTNEELAEIEKADPYKHFLLTTPLGQAMCAVAAGLPVHLRNSPKWELPLRSASPELQASVQHLLYLLRSKAMGASQKSGSNSLDEQATVDNLRIDFEPCESLGASADSGLPQGFYGILEVGGFEIPLLGNDSPFRKLYGKALVSFYTDPSFESPSLDEVEFTDPTQSFLLEDRRVLEETVEIKNKHSRDCTAWLQAIHEKSGWLILSDSYRERFGTLSGKVMIKKILQEIASKGKELIYKDSVLLITNRRWYMKRCADIPDDYLEYYTTKATKSGLTLDDLKQIALDLSRDQIIGNLLEHDAFREYRIFLSHPRQLAAMRFIACLSDAQKTAISVDRNRLESLSDLEFSAPELSADTLSDKALEYALEAVGKDISYIVGKRVTFSHYSEPEPLGPNLQFIYVRMNLVDPEGKRESLRLSVTIPGSDWFKRTKPQTGDSE